MTEAIFTLGVVAVAIVLLALEWLAPDLILLAALGVVTAAGILKTDDALLGFADPTLLAIGSLFVVASGLRATGVLRVAASLLLGRGRSRRAVLGRLTVATATASAFLNNTPIVAMGIPAVLSWSRGKSQSASKLLIPLSYASILGGVCTLIGTSTNLVADGLLRDAGHDPLGFFELARIGVPLGLLGIAYLVFVAPRWLPDRPRLEAASDGKNGTIHLRRLDDDSVAVGRTVREAGLGTPELHLVRMVRASGQVVQVEPDTPLQKGDRLTFRGDATAMAETAGRLGLEPVEQGAADFSALHHLREVVIPEGSPLTESSVSRINFPGRFGAAVLGVVRNGRQLDTVQSVVLRPGDSLFLATSEGFTAAYGDSRDFYVIGGVDVDSSDEPSVALWKPTRAKAGVAILTGIVALASSGVVDIAVAALLGALTMVALGYLAPAEARRSINWSVLIVIGSAIGLGLALRESGAADLIAQGIVTLGTPFGPRGILAALLVASMLFTLVITNNAAVAILFPVALSVAGAQGLDPRPFVIAVTVSSSLAFATPVGYQTNLMVYGPGGYRFSDFVRVGAPLQLLTAVFAVILIPILWPF